MGWYSEKEGKRWFVLFFALVVGIFAVVDLTECGHNYFCFFINIMIIIGTVFGALGAWRMDAKLLGWVRQMFIGLCIIFICFEVGYIIWGFVKNEGARHVLWNFVVTGVLLITIGFARDLRGASTILGDGYGMIP